MAGSIGSLVEANVASVLGAALQADVPRRSADDIFILVFAGIAVILVTARLLGWAFQRIGMPAVVGEVVGGIVLGPSLLGLLPGGLDELLFPPDIRPFLRIVAQMGLVIYMFIVGLELDTRVLGANRRAAMTISLMSISTAFTAGAIVGLIVYTSHDTAVKVGTDVEVEVDRLAFVLFCGLSIAGSAFAILARILEERGLFRTRMGPVLVGCAVVDDIAVWALAAVVLAISASGGLGELPVTLGGLALFIAFLFAAIRPLFARWIDRVSSPDRPLPPDLLAGLVVGLLASACVTTWLGISPILGPFLFGAALPRIGTDAVLQETADRLESLSVLVLLPVFFVVTGLGVDLGGLGLDGFVLLLVFIAVATGGKFIGASLAARTQGFQGRRAMGVGFLMNTRGLTELAILALGRDLGVLDTTMFSVLVTTAIATTMISGPLLGRVYPTALIEEDIAEAERQRVALTDNYRVLVLVDDPETDGAVAELAAAVAVSEPGGEVVLSRFGLLEARGELGTGFIGELTAMTTMLEKMAGLSQRVEAIGPQAVPLSQFTDDVDRELLAQVRRTRPNLVVLAERDDHTWERAAMLVQQARVDVAVVSPSGLPAGPLRLASGNEPDLVLAAEIALRLSLGTGRVVEIDPGRRTAALAPVLAELGAVLAEPNMAAVVASEPDDEGAAAEVESAPTAPSPREVGSTGGAVAIQSGRAPGAIIAALSPVPNDGRRTLDPVRARLARRVDSAPL